MLCFLSLFQNVIKKTTFTFTMDSLVCAMSVITPSEMMRRMKYCEPSVTADAYLIKRQQVNGKEKLNDENKKQLQKTFYSDVY